MKNSFLKGFTWLALGNLVAKFFGGIYKIILTNIVGGQNIGVYQQLLPVYSFVIVLSSVGVPLGVSKMLANIDDKEKAFNSTKHIFLIYSCILAGILALFSKVFANGHGNGKYWVVYVLLTPAVVLSSLSAVYKGYFQSIGDFRPTAISNVVEQIAKIVIAVGIIALFVSVSFWQIIFAIIAIVVGELVAFVVLKNMKKEKDVSINFDDIKFYLKKLKINVLPIILTGLVLSLTNLIDSFLVVRLLNQNFSLDQSVYLYGLQTGVVGTLCNLPATITFAIVSVLVPNLARDFSRKDEKAFSAKFQLAFKCVLAITIPCVMFLTIYPQNVVGLIYRSNLNAFNMNGQIISSKLLIVSATNIVFSCLATLFAMCLQARNVRSLPVVNSIVGAIIKLVLEIIFVPYPSLNIVSFALSSVVGNLTIMALNFYALTRENLKPIKVVDVLKILLASTIALAVSLVLAVIQLNNWTFVLIAMLSVVVYLLVLVKAKIFDKNEIKSLISAKKQI